MTNLQLIHKIESFNPVIKQEIIDYIEFLESKYIRNIKPKKKTSITKFPFIGMWKDRPEMKDSVAYVKELRKKQFLRQK